MTTLREAAQQALEALELHAKQYPHMQKGYTVDAITALRAALAEPENWELRRLREELERCKQTCAATSEAWRQGAALAEPVQEPFWVCPDSAEHRYQKSGHCEDCGKTLVQETT